MKTRFLHIAVILGLVLGILPFTTILAFAPGSDAFERTWARTDRPVLEGQVNRTWMWGPSGFTEAFLEPYADAPGGFRLVQYMDKSRMEDNSFRATPPWDVTNGRLAWELITGQMQTGDSSFEYRGPANIHVAGDTDPDSPTYASFAHVLDHDPHPQGSYINQTLHKNGSIGNNEVLTLFGITASHYVPQTNHTVASVFWTFMNSSGLVYEFGQYQNAKLFENPFFATGYPITEAYWLEVPVGGYYTYVLTQCFERRCLTYTPENPVGWRVEAGNIGQHYYNWRYNEPVGPPPMDEAAYNAAINEIIAITLFTFDWFDELLTSDEIHDTWLDEWFTIMDIWEDLYFDLEDLDPPPGYGPYHNAMLDAYWELLLASDYFVLAYIEGDFDLIPLAFDKVNLFVDLFIAAQELRPAQLASQGAGAGESALTKPTVNANLLERIETALSSTPSD